MRRSSLRPGKPLQRKTALRNKAPLRTQRRDAPAVERGERPMAKLTRPLVLRPGTYAGSVSGEAVDKQRASQSTAYMRAAKALGYCMRCGATPGKGLLDFCHRDQTKGLAIKTDVREGWPGCRACHWFVGTSGQLSKAERRAEELRLGAMTRTAIRAAGAWPKRLEDWREEG